MSESEGKPVGRRVVLSMLGLGAAGIAAAPVLQSGWQRLLDADPIGITGLLPNSGGFRYFSVAASVPVQNEGNYRLTVDGLVDRPRSFTLAELAAVLLGHIRLAYRDPLARVGMRTGYVRLSWAREEHPNWLTVR